MQKPLVLSALILAIGALLSGIHLQARAAETDALDPDLPLLKRSRDTYGNDNYRYDFDERKLTFGVDLGAGLTGGSTMNAFPIGATATPYFRGAFGDGTALELDLTLGFSPVSGANAEWLFFRTPIEGGEATGYVALLAPTVAFRYDIELTSSISKQATFLLWTGIGLGPAFTRGSADLTGNGSQPDKELSNFEMFFDLLPTAGIRMRMGEFGFLQLGTRIHFLWMLGGKVNEDEKMSFGDPDVIQEFWIGNFRLYDVFLGFGYDFG